MVRDSRKLFLSKRVWHTFKGYAYAQLHKLERKPEGNRKELVEKHGYDVKFAYHVVRLMDEVAQILATGDLDLQSNREQLKAIRRGEWTLEQIRQYFDSKERDLESLYTESNVIPYTVDEGAIKQLLLNCLEEHFGSLSGALIQPGKYSDLMRELRELTAKYEERANHET
jgi:hypothetical protein